MNKFLNFKNLTTGGTLIVIGVLLTIASIVLGLVSKYLAPIFVILIAYFAYKIVSRKMREHNTFIHILVSIGIGIGTVIVAGIVGGIAKVISGIAIFVGLVMCIIQYTKTKQFFFKNNVN